MSVQWMALIRNSLSQFSWYRDSEGGHWELWRLPDKFGTAWMKVDICFHVSGKAPLSGMSGIPLSCEHYWDDGKRPGKMLPLYITELHDKAPCPICGKPVVDHEDDPHHWFIDESKRIRPLHRICTGQLVKVPLTGDTNFKRKE